MSCLLGSRKRQGGFALLVFIEGNELLLLTMKEVEWCTEKRKRKKVKENKSPLVWILGITITSFILLQRDKCNSVTIVWKGEVYMQGKFFFSGHGKLSVTTSYCGPFSNWALIPQMCSLNIWKGLIRLNKSKTRKPFLVVCTLWPLQCKLLGWCLVCGFRLLSIMENHHSLGNEILHTRELCWNVFVWPSRIQEKYWTRLEHSKRS